MDKYYCYAELVRCYYFCSVVRRHYTQGQGTQPTILFLFPGSRTNDNQIVFDFHQIPRDSLPQLRDTLLSLLATFAKGPKPIRTQLCVCLANLAIQMLEWKDVLPMVVSTLGNDQNSLPCVLDFLRVLPEEVTEGRKINLTVCPATRRFDRLSCVA